MITSSIPQACQRRASPAYRKAAPDGGRLCDNQRQSRPPVAHNAGMTLEELYKDLHAHPELAFAERRTAALAAEWLAGAGFEVIAGVGGTGVAGVLRNGDGPAALVRADMDALPLREDTGLDYASEVEAVDARGERTPVMHACGHDMHVTCLCGAAAELAATTGSWRGTLIAVFQPAEEVGLGARAMLDDGLYAKVGVPDLVLGQHVYAQDPGQVLYRPGPFLAAAESWDVTFHGSGSHGSRPQDAVDPVVMASSAVLRLQTLVAREIAPADKGVVTVSRLRAGHAENVIPDSATITLNFRAFDPAVHRRLTEGARRIIDAEAVASAAPRPPEYHVLAAFPVTVNDDALTARLAAAFDHTRLIEPRMGSEDVGAFGAAAGAPTFFWGLGGAAAGSPGNHTPQFAPQIEPTLTAGVSALVTAVRAALPAA
jgi:amidohydrolase